MTRLLFLILLVYSSRCFAQTDANGNPTVNSVILNEEQVGNYMLVSSYYTLKGNIDNKGSSVFISKEPTLLEIDYAAMHQLSDFFLVAKNHFMLRLIKLVNYGSK